MLISSYHRAPRITHSKQKGVTLIITLIILVAMTLAAIAMVRSVDTSNLIAGNLAFQQSARNAADAGAEAAINIVLPSLITGNQLKCTTVCPSGYISWREPLLEPPVKSWSQFWTSVSGNAYKLSTDQYGNTASFVIQAMCDSSGQGPTCLAPPASITVTCVGSDLGASTQKCTAIPKKYYRITTRVEGPRNSVAYTQTIVTM